MIEFLPPRDDAFGERDVADFVGVDGDDTGWDDDEPPRSRWLTAVAAIGVLGLLTGGVLAAEPWSGDDSATPPSTAPSTSSAPSTVPAPSTTGPDDTLPDWMDDSIPGYVLPEDSPLVATFAVSYPDDVWTGDAIDLWAEPGATRFSGRWLVVDSMSSDGDFQALLPDATRIEHDDATVLVHTDVDGVVHMVVDPPASTRFELISRGVGLDELLAVIPAIDAGRTVNDYDPAFLGPDGTLAGLPFVTATRLVTGYGLVGVTPSAVVSYTDPSDGTYIEVSLSRVDPAAVPVTSLVIGRRLDPTTLDDATQDALASLRRRGFDPEVRESTGAEGIGNSLHAVLWTTESGGTVSVMGTGDVADVADAAARVVLASPVAWRRLVASTVDGVEMPATPDQTTTVIADDPKASWSAQVWGDWFSIYGQSFYTNAPFEPGSGPRLQAYRSLDQAFLLATNTWPNTGLRVVVTQPGVEPAPPARLVQVDDRPVYAVVVRLEPDQPYTVEWLDLDGVAVAGPAT